MTAGGPRVDVLALTGPVVAALAAGDLPAAPVLRRAGVGADLPARQR